MEDGPRIPASDVDAKKYGSFPGANSYNDSDSPSISFRRSTRRVLVASLVGMVLAGLVLLSSTNASVKVNEYGEVLTPNVLSPPPNGRAGTSSTPTGSVQQVKHGGPVATNGRMPTDTFRQQDAVAAYPQPSSQQTLTAQASQRSSSAPAAPAAPAQAAPAPAAPAAPAPPPPDAPPGAPAGVQISTADHPCSTGQPVAPGTPCQIPGQPAPALTPDQAAAIAKAASDAAAARAVQQQQQETAQALKEKQYAEKMAEQANKANESAQKRAQGSSSRPKK